MISRSVWRHFDWSLFLVTIVLVVIGSTMIYSAYELGAPAEEGALLENLVVRQALFAAIGLVLYLGAAAIDYRTVVSLHRWVYLFTLAPLAITLLVGRVRFGAQSWLSLEGFGVQPSELAKILLIFVLARMLGSEQQDLERPWPLLLSMAAVAPVALLIYLQPDFGTALILVATWFGMVFLAGTRWRHLGVLLLLVMLASPLVWGQMEGYMRERFVTFLNPDRDPSGASYNVNQALISIGSGGWWGKGPFRGTQTQLHFLRVRHTDFIFSVLAEEMGFVGSILLLGLFAFLILRLIHISWTARDSYGRLVAGGVATMILVQMTINLGMNANLMPVTGLPLPLVSYGGSSLITTLLALGACQSVAMRRGFAEKSPAYLTGRTR
jgi:rod shape determining protein RodA